MNKDKEGKCMILYQECKRLDKVKGRQEVVDGKLRDQCMLCEFYEMCNSCFFFGSSNAEKESAIADMISNGDTQKLNTVLAPSYRDSRLYVHLGASGDESRKGPTIKNEFIFNKTKSEMVSDPKRYAEARIEALKQKRGK